MYTCPLCGSANTASARSVYQQGTVDHSGYVTGNRGGASYSGVSQTRLAARASPPAPKRSFLQTIGVSIGLSVLLFIPLMFILFAVYGKKAADVLETTFEAFGVGQWVGWFTFTPICVMIALPFAIRNWKYNSYTHPRLYQEWLSTWYCYHCERFFIRDKR